MRIQHNIAALNSHRQLGSNNSAVSKNLEKLSSGYRINRAGDDAAGLAISEKMRAQITGLDTAQKNAQDGISLVQTAEGALTEVHSMLNRMTELADQSANGTYQDSVDRENIQKELDSLRSEIDRISEGTNFNGIKLLDGTLSADGAASAAAAPDTVTYTGPKGVRPDDVDAIAGVYEMAKEFTDHDGMALGDKVSYTFEYTDKNGVAKSKTIELTMSKLSTDETKFSLVDADGNEYTLAADTASDAKLADIQSAVKSILEDDEDFSANFEIATTADNLTITAVDKGVNGAVLTGVKSSSTVKATGAVTVIANAAEATTVAKDEYQSVNLNDLEAFDGTNADKAIFDINGKKFAFVDSALSGDDLTKALDALKEAGVEHYVTTAGQGTIAAADVTEMVSKINYETGLDVKQGTNTNGVFAGNTTGTEISLTTRETGRTEQTAATGGLTLQIGDTSDDFNQLTVSISSMSSASLGLGEISVGTQEDAKAAVDVIKSAINSVSSTRGDLGAIQNRLEHTINNLGVTSENMSAAESRIRDVDMAEEMMTFTKNNILTQASQAMLAQANQLPQGVLQLLQ